MNARILKRCILTTLALALLITAPATASLVTMDFSGTMGAGTTLVNGANTTQLGGTPFALSAKFDTGTGSNAGTGAYMYSLTSALFTLNGSEYTLAPGFEPPGNIGMMLDVSSNPNGWAGFYLIQPYDPNNASMLAMLFAGSTPTLDAANPQAVTFGNLATSMVDGNFNMADGSILHIDPANPPAGVTGGSQTSAVPEPSTYALFCIGLAGMAVIRKRKAIKDPA